MSEALKQLLDILKLEKIDTNLYRGITPETSGKRVFGGQVFAQAMRAAQDTVDSERMVHSQHAYFLRPGDPSVPILYDVDNIRDGGSFTTRRVVASQRGKAIFNTSLSFQILEPGLSHQCEMPQCPSPEDLTDDSQHWDKIREQLNPTAKTKPKKHRPRLLPIQMRSVEPIDYINPVAREAEQFVWIKTAGELPTEQDAGLHNAILAYASDFSLMSTALMPHEVSIMNPKLQPASLDHAIWFHDSFRADEWLLYHMDSLRSSRSRGLSRGTFYSRDGRLVASTIQEGLMRLRDN
ncbi:MAG: acyl-CoA thioesterase II [Porticoccaceae bacterium]|nr:acyl-CoA thioesterase II [Porticoccaceae bacterium]